MDLSKILSISGRPGLYKMLTQTKAGVIVESFTDKKRFPVFAHERMSSLEEISIFTEEEDLPLKDVLKKIHDFLAGEKAPDASSDESELWEFFGEAIPEFDRERVYKSDVKKVISWYNILLEHDMLSFEEDEEENGKKPSEDEKPEAKPSAEKGGKGKSSVSKAKSKTGKSTSVKAAKNKSSSAKAAEGDSKK